MDSGGSGAVVHAYMIKLNAMHKRIRVVKAKVFNINEGKLMAIVCTCNSCVCTLHVHVMHVYAILTF